MNRNEPGDAGVVQISVDRVKTFSERFDQPEGIVYLGDHLYFSGVSETWKVDSEGSAGIFADAAKVPEFVYYRYLKNRRWDVRTEVASRKP